jgi:hypothetical protein
MLKKIFLISTSLAFIALMASFYFIGTFQTLLLLGIAGELADRTLDSHIGLGKKMATIDGKEFSVPEEYLTIATKAKGIYKDNVIFHLEYIWPDMTPVRLAKGEDYKTAKEEKRNAYLWVEKAWPEKMSEHLSIKPNKDGIVKNELVGKRGNFEEYAYFVKDRESGNLKHIGTGFIIRDESKNITDALDCYGPYPPNNTLGCTYYFLDKGLLYNVRFNDKPEPDIWAEWKKKNIEFIDQYRIN